MIDLNNSRSEPLANISGLFSTRTSGGPVWAANTLSSHMSVGEQQRFAVARGLTNRPRLVLMDEPTGSLEEENSRELIRLVKATVLDKKVTLEIARHDRDRPANAVQSIPQGL